MQAAQNLYGPIGSRDTLWEIAETLKPSPKLSTQQVIMALYNKNQHAFTVNNINSLRKDAYMLAPSLEEASSLSRQTAVEMVKRHNTRWKNKRYVRIDAEPPAALLQALQAQQQQTTPLPPADRTDTPAPASTTAASPTPETVTETPLVETLEGKTTEQQLAIVKRELTQARTENQRLQQELQTLKSDQQQATQQQVDAHIQAQLDALRHELAELRTILAQKDNHIKTLQTSLKSASEAIKSQHADNMRLYNKLKELSPDSLPAQQTTAARQPQLELAAVSTGESAPTPTAATENSEAESGIAQVWADEVQAPDTQTKTTGGTTGSSIPLNQILNPEGSHAALLESPPLNESSGRPRVSPIAWAAVLVSFVFILFLIIRSLIMQNELRRMERE
ncbi:MAG: FimV/HubP family polar landmark protein [Thiolinea sp.]